VVCFDVLSVKRDESEPEAEPEREHVENEENGEKEVA